VVLKVPARGKRGGASKKARRKESSAPESEDGDDAGDDEESARRVKRARGEKAPVAGPSKAPQWAIPAAELEDTEPSAMRVAIEKVAKGFEKWGKAQQASAAALAAIGAGMKDFAAAFDKYDL
jgi:hypothetical protein